MTDDEIRKLAEEAGFDHSNHDAWWTYVIPKFRRLIELVQAKEMNHDARASYLQQVVTAAVQRVEEGE